MKKNLLSIVIFVIAALILAAGITQMVLFTKPQMKMLDDALEQGYPQEAIDEYYWQQFMPQLLPNAIVMLGFTTVLAALGALLLKRHCCEPAAPAPATECECGCGGDDVDELLEEYEAVE